MIFPYYSLVFKGHTPTLPSAHPLSMGLPDPLKARPGTFQSSKTPPYLMTLYYITYIHAHMLRSTILIPHGYQTHV